MVRKLINNSVLWIAIFVLFLAGVIIYIKSSVVQMAELGISKEQVLEIAQETPEVKALFSLNPLLFSRCIEKKVKPACESDWVTCIEDAWIVQFVVGNQCSIEHDGRLNITFLIDQHSGTIISKFPEADYFQSNIFCLEDYDCIYLTQGKESVGQCQNFVFGQLNGKAAFKELKNEKCECVNRICVGGN